MTEEEKKLKPETVENTQAAGANTAAAPTFKDSYGQKLQAQYDAIVNRKPFSYNAAEDPLYQQYVDKYVQGGRLAMRDSMGQAAALTGGYGSSYGQAVGQQQYNEYMRSLSNAMPTLYGQAFQQYQAEGDQMAQEYAMLGQLQDDEYSKFRDAYADWLYGEEQAYARQQDAYGNLQNLIAATGMTPSAEQMGAAGMQQNEADALRLAYARSDPDYARRAGIITDAEYTVLTGIDPNASYGGGGEYYARSDPWLKEMQKAMMAEGIALPKYGADGILGDETIAAINSWEGYEKWSKEHPAP